MSLEIATELREEARRVLDVAERVSGPDDRRALAQVAARLVQTAERLERDARD